MTRQEWEITSSILLFPLLLVIEGVEQWNGKACLGNYDHHRPGRADLQLFRVVILGTRRSNDHDTNFTLPGQPPIASTPPAALSALLVALIAISKHPPMLGSATR